jgi:hypothetical protein
MKNEGLIAASQSEAAIKYWGVKRYKFENP